MYMPFVVGVWGSIYEPQALTAIPAVRHGTVGRVIMKAKNA